MTPLHALIENGFTVHGYREDSGITGYQAYRRVRPACRKEFADHPGSFIVVASGHAVGDVYRYLAFHCHSTPPDWGCIEANVAQGVGGVNEP